MQTIVPRENPLYVKVGVDLLSLSLSTYGEAKEGKISLVNRVVIRIGFNTIYPLFKCEQ